MGYEKELAELRKEWKKSTDKYEEAIEDGYDVDADMWAHDVMEIERQIYVYEQATKAEGYEAKLAEVKKQLQAEAQLAKRSGNDAEELAFTEALNMIENLI